MLGFFEHVHKNSVFEKGEEFFGQMSYCKLLKDFATRNYFTCSVRVSFITGGTDTFKNYFNLTET